MILASKQTTVKETSMRAVEISRYGGPDVMRVVEVGKPAGPARGQVLVHVAAAGVNPVDLKAREGYLKDFMPFTFPTILGGEIAGTIVAVGDGVVDLPVGAEVNGSTALIGGFSEYAIANDCNACPETRKREHGRSGRRAHRRCDRPDRVQRRKCGFRDPHPHSCSGRRCRQRCGSACAAARGGRNGAYVSPPC